MLKILWINTFLPMRLGFCSCCCHCRHPSGWKGSMPWNADDEKNDTSYFLVPSSKKNEPFSPFSSYEEKGEEGSFFYVAVRQRIVLCHTSKKDALLRWRRKSELVLFFFVGEELRPLFFFLNAEEITLSAAYPKKKGDEPCFIFFVNEEEEARVFTAARRRMMYHGKPWYTITNFNAQHIQLVLLQH